MSMYCDFCPDKPKLSPLIEVTGEQPHSHDFDTDGKVFRICPTCLTVDTISLREERLLIKIRKQTNSSYSRRDKKVAVFHICKLLGLKDENRKITISKIMKVIKPLSDSECFERISKELKISPIKVELLFYNVKRYREYRM